MNSLSPPPLPSKWATIFLHTHCLHAFSPYISNLVTVELGRNLMYVSYLYLSNHATIDLDNFSYAFFSVSQQRRQTNLCEGSAVALNGLSGDTLSPPPPQPHLPSITGKYLKRRGFAFFLLETTKTDTRYIF